jgi:DNA-binding MarR family transcriptional regulator/N-acetylglutamate synthase-like GNAT family acetyltransferase
MSTTIEKLGYLAGVTRFRRISEKLYVDGDKVYREAGIPFKASWFPVYYVLAISESPISILQIAEQIDFSHITVKNVLRELEKDELITIETNPADKRSRLVSLSVKGQKLIYRLKPVWISISSALMNIFHAGHPDFMNILNRIDHQIDVNPINKRISVQDTDPVAVLDYNPALNQHFYELAGPWLTEELNGSLKEEGGITLETPEAEHFMNGGFIFYARYKDQIVGFVALKRLDEQAFEFTWPYIHPNYHKLEIEKIFLERCICRCIENQAIELWSQTSIRKTEAYELFRTMGFEDCEAHPKMKVQEETKRVMCLKL